MALDIRKKSGTWHELSVPVKDLNDPIWLVLMRLTDFWDRMEQALGAAYARSWAADFHVPSLDGRTVDQALSQGEDTQTVWRAVHQTLDLHPKYR
jgi:hypothetical protein